jgi:alkanesulfonate monooxygenase
VAPTLTACKATTLDHFTSGRLALHVIIGGSDAEQARDGDWVDHDTRYRRTDDRGQ